MTEEGTRRRGRPRAEGVRVAVIGALIGLVAEQGYAGTSMDEVAERAGVSKAAIYRRWPSKDALIVDAHRSMLNEADVPDTGTLRGDLVALLDRVADLMEDERIPRVMQATVGEMLTNPELQRVFQERVLEPRLAMVGEVFARATARGEVQPGADWRSLAYALIGSNIFRVAFMSERPDREANRHLVDLVVRDTHRAEPEAGERHD
ncbi:MAG: TetR/AcrR family transcriptional regulator [Dehalococcoidia bacterium]